MEKHKNILILRKMMHKSINLYLQIFIVLFENVTNMHYILAYWLKHHSRKQAIKFFHIYLP